MLILRRLILLFVLINVGGSNFIVLGQIWLDNAAIYDEAEGYIEGEEFDEAIPLFQLLEKKGFSSPNISYKLGVCLLNTIGKKTLSIPYFKDAVTNSSSDYKGDFTDSTAPLKAYIYLGIAYRIDNKFDESIACFEIYKDSTNDIELKKMADFYINQTNMAEFFTSTPSKSSLIKLNTKSVYSLSNPVVDANSSVFYMESKPFYNAVISGNIKDSEVSEKENLTPVIGNEEDISLVSISPNGNKLIFTAYVIGKGYELFFSEKDSLGNWGQYQIFPDIINSPGNESFASISATGKELYFSSNRHGGYGGNDIYRTELIDDNVWSVPINLGAKINTPYNEEVCAISPNGEMLIISSEGHLNIGGYDLFYAKRDISGGWGAPTNFGSPVSTTDDDNFLSISSLNNLYTSRFSSTSGGKEELYAIDLASEPLQPKVLVKTRLLFTDDITPKEVSYLIKLDDKTVIDRSLTSENGTTQKYLPAGAYVYHYVYNENIKAQQKIVIPDNMLSDEIILEAPDWEINLPKTEKNILVIKDILFEFNSYHLSDSYFNMLDSVAGIMNMNYVSTLVVDGHTDALGSKTYNEKLSLKRAEAVEQYLLNRGGDKEKLIIHGKGEDLPVAINSNSDGTDNSLGRKFNRRVSILIELNEEGVLIEKANSVPKELILK